MAMNVITYEWDKNGKPRRVIDKIAMAMNKAGLFKARDGWSIEDTNNNTVGALYTIEGLSIVTGFLAWATNYHGKGEAVDITVDCTGNITKVKNIKES